MCQIYWRGDDCIEYFSVKFRSAEEGKKWVDQIECQRRVCQEQMRRNPHFETSETEFTFLREHHGNLMNPYELDDYDENRDIELRGHDRCTSRTASRTSSRSRSGTGDSGPPTSIGDGRAPTPRYPHPGAPGAPLTLRTQHLQGPSPGPDRSTNSYFSPTADSPMSVRTSSSSGPLSLPRQSTPLSAFQSEESNRYTAPAYMRLPDLVSPTERPSDRTTLTQSNQVTMAHPAALSQTRSRSVSSPDVNASERHAAGTAPPVPHVPSHHMQIDSRSVCTTTNSPNRMNRPMPQGMQILLPPNPYQVQYSRDGVLDSSPADTAMMSPPLSNSTPSFNQSLMSSQLKIKVKVPSEGSSFVLVTSDVITYRALKEKIDAKLSRHCDLSLEKGTVKLKYLYDDEFVMIQTDEDIQTAFETWKEQQRDMGFLEQHGAIELYCHR